MNTPNSHQGQNSRRQNEPNCLFGVSLLSAEQMCTKTRMKTRNPGAENSVSVVAKCSAIEFIVLPPNWKLAAVLRLHFLFLIRSTCVSAAVAMKTFFHVVLSAQRPDTLLHILSHFF